MFSWTEDTMITYFNISYSYQKLEIIQSTDHNLHSFWMWCTALITNDLSISQSKAAISEASVNQAWPQTHRFHLYQVFDAQKNMINTVRAPVFIRHQFFGTSKHYGKSHGILLSGWINYYYTACCWFPTFSNILILPSQFWQIGFESYWLHCSKCRILVLLR